MFRTASFVILKVLKFSWNILISSTNKYGLTLVARKNINKTYKIYLVLWGNLRHQPIGNGLLLWSSCRYQLRYIQSCFCCVPCVPTYFSYTLWHDMLMPQIFGCGYVKQWEWERKGTLKCEIFYVLVKGKHQQY